MKERLRPHYGVHVAPTAELIQDLAARKAVAWSYHAVLRAEERGLTWTQVHSALANGVEIIADYPTDPKGHSCKVRCVDASGNVIECICAVCISDECHELQLRIVSLWVPDRPSA